ncbi:M23 family metallopeptidase [Bordetella genomosp. 9]|nr:M23 family metallopeptidase [Bordetella genomosp. 9]
MRNKTNSRVLARIRAWRSAACIAVLLTAFAGGAVLHHVGSKVGASAPELSPLLPVEELPEWSDESVPFGEDERLHIKSGLITGGIAASLARARVPQSAINQALALASTRAPDGAEMLRFKIAYAVREYAVEEVTPRLVALQIGDGEASIAAVRYPLRGDGEPTYYDFHGNPWGPTSFAWPVARSRASSPFGGRIHPVLGVAKFHRGVDLAAPQGTPVMASAPGTVTFVGNVRGYGNLVALRHANGLESYYAHLHAIASTVGVGTRVAQRDVIGTVGATGTATGPHLHFEIRQHGRPLDPITLMPSRPRSDPDFSRDLRKVRAHFAPEGVAMHRFVRLYSQDTSRRI